MQKRSYFHNVRRAGWPSLVELAPYFLAKPADSGWFRDTGNDGASLDLEGVRGTEHLPPGQGRADISLTVWGNPELGVLLQYARYGGGVPRQDWFYARTGSPRVTGGGSGNGFVRCTTRRCPSASSCELP